jgi:hypothetical protein
MKQKNFFKTILIAVALMLSYGNATAQSGEPAGTFAITVPENAKVIIPADYIVVNAVADGNIVIYDLTGKMVLNTTVKAGANRINTSTLHKGIYVLKSGSNAVKIIK